MDQNVKNIGNTTKDFFKSNSLVAKVAFILLVVFAFVIILRFAISIMGTLFTRNSRVTKFFDGMVDGKQLLVYPQDPSTEGSKTINRSVYPPYGEFSKIEKWRFGKNTGEVLTFDMGRNGPDGIRLSMSGPGKSTKYYNEDGTWKN